MGEDCLATSTYYEGKEIALLFNTKRIDYSERSPKVQNYTEMIWLPIQKQQALESVISSAAHRFSDPQFGLLQMLGVEADAE